MDEILDPIPAPVQSNDLYLRFPDKETADELLADYEGAIDIIGVISTVDNTDPENPVVIELPGWHVNTRGPASDELRAYDTAPSTPYRIWA